MSYKKLKQKLLSTSEGKVETFKMQLAFALHDWHVRKGYCAEQICELVSLSVKDLILLQTGDLDLTLSQILKIAEVIGAGLEVKLSAGEKLTEQQHLSNAELIRQLQARYRRFVHWRNVTCQNVYTMSVSHTPKE